GLCRRRARRRPGAGSAVRDAAMRRAACVAAAIIAVTLPAAPVAAASGRVSVHDDRTAVNTTLGGTFVFTTTIVNHDRTTVSGLIAHLNVLSFGPGVYVDPEDWSSRRTRYLAPIPPGGSESVTWGLEAVNTGSFGVYVAVLPRSGVARPP